MQTLRHIKKQYISGKCRLLNHLCIDDKTIIIIIIHSKYIFFSVDYAPRCCAMTAHGKLSFS
ncbi:hypothetical protein DMB90_25170 [Raoultella planticola]|uniref:Uncharacterized protein n=1 Tax=Raoultella planticola TaxID=575 RepID=A0A5P6AB09_RAOPL|nr:hypothetical protein DMB90_25170 [Raoultella planticola]